MIETSSRPSAYETVFSARNVQFTADAPMEKGGKGEGFGPHELLEAALATCINIAVRMSAAKLGIVLEDVATSVQLDRSRSDVVIFKYTLDLAGPVTTDDRKRLEEAAEACPVRQTLVKRMEFVAV